MSDAGPAFLIPDWPVAAHVRAAVSLRGGGVSTGAFGSLNLAGHVGDDPADVAENRRRLRAALQLPDEPLWLAQVHGVEVVDADALQGRGGQAPDSGPPRGDAAIARVRSRVLAILVADCLPVLLARLDGTAIGVSHAGWRGLSAGVLEATVAALCTPPEALCAWLGPAIGPAHFEVGDEVRAAFCASDPGAAAAFEPNARGRWQCDLAGLARRRLAALGLREIHGAVPCTYADPERFYSYRRDGITGRLAALLWMGS